MIFVYPLGIPLMYGGLLWSIHKELTAVSLQIYSETVMAEEVESEPISRTPTRSQRHNRTTDDDKETDMFEGYSASAMRLVFLLLGIEFFAVISVISPGTSAQNVLSMLLSPYEEDSDDFMAELGQYQVLFTFFTVLIVSSELVDSDYNTALGELVACDIEFGSNTNIYTPFILKEQVVDIVDIVQRMMPC
jgi:hypothetical protein